MKKSTILLSIILLNFYSATAQNNSQKAVTIVGDRIRFSLTNNFKPDKGFQMDSCINTIVFTKFKLVKGQIDSAIFSVHSPAQIRIALQNAFAAFNRQERQLKELKELEGRTFLLPVIVYYNIGCTPASYVTEISPQKALEVLTKNPDFPLHAALNDGLKFDTKEKYSAIDCIFINPVYFSVLQ